METDQSGGDATQKETENESKFENRSEVVNDPEVLQSVLESLVGSMLNLMKCGKLWKKKRTKDNKS